MSKSVATIVGGAAGALGFMAIFIGFVWFCKSQCKHFSNKNSETGSSDPSALGPSSAIGQPLFGPHGARQFTMEELEQATRQFSESALIGYGSFGPVYKGLLPDTVVVIKRRQGSPRPEFVTEANYLSEIRHRSLVTLLGYCQERGSQMLVYEYLPNGSICNHLYDIGRESSAKLEFKQRISIALGAAKGAIQRNLIKDVKSSRQLGEFLTEVPFTAGLCHLHGLRPPLVHKNFKSANVMVDEDFIAKVADAGVSALLEKIEEAGPSQMSSVNLFRDPEVEDSGLLTEMSDVYSFGVFLLELVTGQEAFHVDSLGSYEALIEWVRSSLSSNDFVDRRLFGTFTTEGMRDFVRLTLQCMSSPATRRPKMETVMIELERIHEKEMALTTVMGEGTATITLGSELFTSK